MPSHRPRALLAPLERRVGSAGEHASRIFHRFRRQVPRPQRRGRPWRGGAGSYTCRYPPAIGSGCRVSRKNILDARVGGLARPHARSETERTMADHRISGRQRQGDGRDGHRARSDGRRVHHQRQAHLSRDGQFTGGPAVSTGTESVVYTGYSWRGRSTTTKATEASPEAAGGVPIELRETMWIAPDQSIRWKAAGLGPVRRVRYRCHAASRERRRHSDWNGPDHDQDRFHLRKRVENLSADNLCRAS